MSVFNWLLSLLGDVDPPPRPVGKLGLKPPVPGAIPLRMATYLDFNQLPDPPAEFGHYQLIDNWGVLANTSWGCCAESGACHQEMLWTKEGTGTAAPFDDAATLKNYSAISQFNPNAGPSDHNPTDTGTAMGDLARYWVNTGIVDANGTHHKIVAVMDMNPCDLRELWVATYLFQTVGLGFAMPASALNQTRVGQPWDVVADDGGIRGGHYVPCVGRAGGNGVVVTWGRTQPFTPAFYSQYNNQGIVGLSEDMMAQAKSIDGFDDALLRDDLESLRSEHMGRAF